MSVKSTDYDVSTFRDMAEKDPHAPIIFARVYGVTMMPLIILSIAMDGIGSILMLPVFFIVVGITQNALGILMHEGSHGFLSTCRGRNDLLADLLICYPLYNTVSGYREGHFRHHRYFGTSMDPYFPLYNISSKHHLWAGLMQDMTGFTAARAFFARYGHVVIRPEKTTDSDVSSPERFRVVALPLVHGLIWLAMYRITGWYSGYLFFWLMPLMTIPFVINRIRTIVEHALPTAGGSISRTIYANALESALFAPYGYRHHAEHHRYPGIPYHRLGMAHTLRVRSLGVNPDGEEWSKGYMNTFIRIVRKLR